jgi:hypothetical protein
MPLLNFTRDLELNVGGIIISSRAEGQDIGGTGESTQTRPTLRVGFRVERSLVKDPNKAEVKIYNLSFPSRGIIGSQNVGVALEAGYIGNRSRLIFGQLRKATHAKQGTDWVTTIQSIDGINAFRNRISLTFRPNTSVKQIYDAVADELGVGLGTIKAKIEQALARKLGKKKLSTTDIIKNGAVLVGTAADVFQEQLANINLEFSVQNNEAQALSPGELLGIEIVKLNEETGLIGNVEVGEKGLIKARTLLSGAYIPGRGVQLMSLQSSGLFRCERVIHIGDTWGSDWYTDLELRQAS